MSNVFKNSETKENLMRAFVGESQARNRYTIAAKKAKKENLYVVQAVFEFTADQERAHAEIFYNHLAQMAGETIQIEGGYPVDIAEDIQTLLRMAQHNEYEEHEPIYQKFGDIAWEEGFPAVAASFHMIAEIEKLHGDRFGMLAELIEQKKLFLSEVKTGWMCLNCGHVAEDYIAPEVCPVCNHNQGYFIRMELAPFTETIRESK